MTSVRYRTADVDGHEILYRKAGDPSRPTLLLHGFPSSSHMFRDLIPLLADRFHLVAPDLPGFGRSEIKPRDRFTYSFDALARVIGRLTQVIGLARYALYIFDYGAPTGLRIALAHPERVSAIISQNGQRLRGGAERRLGPDPALPARSERREPPGPPRAAHPGLDPLVVRARRSRHRRRVA